MDKKIIAVAGATGAQGGGLARAILADPNGGFAVRALTRKPGSEKAKELATMGAEIVAADLDDVASLKTAYAGAYGAFCVTNFWEHFSPEKEKAQARNMAEAAKSAGLEHVIWSTFEDVRTYVPVGDDRMPALLEKYRVPHFDGKAEANAYFTERALPVTFLYTSFYWDNMINFGTGPKPGPDGTLALTMPMGGKKLPGMAASDIGPCAYGIFKSGPEFVGKTIGIAGEHLTGTQMAAALTEALGRKVVYNAVSPDAYRAFGFPGADEMGNMFQFKADFEDVYCGHRPLDLSRKLNPKLQSFARWLSANASRIPLS